MCIDCYINWFNNKKKEIQLLVVVQICRVMTNNFVNLIKESKEYDKINFKDDEGNKYQILTNNR